MVNLTDDMQMTIASAAAASGVDPKEWIDRAISEQVKREADGRRLQALRRPAPWVGWTFIPMEGEIIQYNGPRDCELWFFAYGTSENTRARFEKVARPWSANTSGERLCDRLGRTRTFRSAEAAIAALAAIDFGAGL